MYKNVLNQYTLGIILSFSFSFAAKAQTTGADPVTYANPDHTSDHPPAVNTGIQRSQQTDTTWKPVRRLWGYAFGDYYYVAHADAANRGPETNYNSVSTYRNAFQFRRIYLGYDYDINRKFAVEVLLASEPSANTVAAAGTAVSNSDNLADNKMSFYIKNFALRWRGVWNGTDLVLGETLTPAFPLLAEKIWGYRSIERTISDFHRTNAYDIGAELQGFFDPAAKNFGYNIMVGNNVTGSPASLSSAANPATGFYKAFYGDVFGKFFNQTVIADVYADYMRTAAATAITGGQARNMFKGFIAYTTPIITFGFEAYTQKITNGVTNTTTKKAENARVTAISVYAHGVIYKDKLGFFARYDGYDPDNDYNQADSYTVNTNLPAYSPGTKEHFYTAGLDLTPAKNIHFEPNIWLMQYTDQHDRLLDGYMPEDHTLVYRLTFFYQFGK